MPPSSKPKRAAPPADQQVELRAALTELTPALLAKASLLCRGLHKLPRSAPDPAELVGETVRRLLARYTDHEVESVSGLAFTTLGRVACDLARKGRGFDGGLIEDDSQVPDESHREIEPFVRRALDALAPRERCVVVRAVIEEIAVPEAFTLCGWTSRSPYAELNKILKRMGEQIRETR